MSWCTYIGPIWIYQVPVCFVFFFLSLNFLVLPWHWWTSKFCHLFTGFSIFFFKMLSCWLAVISNTIFSGCTNWPHKSWKSLQIYTDQNIKGSQWVKLSWNVIMYIYLTYMDLWSSSCSKVIWCYHVNESPSTGRVLLKPIEVFSGYWFLNG